MHNKILITYASRAGSTAEIAGAISDAIAKNGAQVELMPMQDVKNLSSYSAVIIGSPIRKSAWLPEAINFVQKHRTELARQRVAIFTVSITLAMSNAEQFRQAVAGWIAPVRAHVKPVSEGFFAGKLDFTRLPINFDTLKLRLVVALGIFPGDDRRDWKAIYSWADSLQPLLLQ